MAKNVRQDIEATVRFEQSLDFTGLEDMAVRNCARICKAVNESGEACAVTARSDSETRELTLKCGSLVCTQLTYGQHPIIDTMTELVSTPEDATQRNIRTDMLVETSHANYMNELNDMLTRAASN